jgi:hypothetical protein
MTSLAVCALEAVGTATVAAFCVVLFMTCSFWVCLGWLGIVFPTNAERHLAKAEGSKCKERGITQLLKQSGKGRSAAEGCTERQWRKPGETPCARVEAGLLVGFDLEDVQRPMKAGSCGVSPLGKGSRKTGPGGFIAGLGWSRGRAQPFPVKVKPLILDELSGCTSVYLLLSNSG